MDLELRLSPTGGFECDAQPVLPVGVNYLPAGCPSVAELWRNWAGYAESVRRDLDAIVRAGLTAVRVDTTSSHESEAAAQAEFVRACGERSLLVASRAIAPGRHVLPTGECVPIDFRARPGEHVLGFDGLDDPFGHTFLPFAVRLATRQGPALVASLGMGTRMGTRQEDAWLRAVLPATIAAGAIGIFWSAWHGADALVDAAGNLHPGRAYFANFAGETVRALRPRSAEPAIGVFISRESVSLEERRRALLAQYFVTVLGLSWHPVDETTLPAAKCRTVLIPGTRVSRSALDKLHAWTAAGGRLCWHGPNLLTATARTFELLGAAPIDWRSARGISLPAFGERFTLAHFPEDVRFQLEPRTARVLATDQQGLPVLLENACGEGRVRSMLPIVEDAIIPVAAHPASRDRWRSWYCGMFAD